MIFIQQGELRVRKFQSLINDISEEDFYIIEEVEEMAIEEIKSYIRGRYDTDYIFSRTGKDRSALIKRITLDYMLCFLYERLNTNEIPDSLVERCDKNTSYLKDVAKGIISPDLQPIDPSQPNTFFQGGSETSFNNTDNLA